MTCSVGRTESEDSAVLPEWVERLTAAALAGQGRGNKVTMVTPWVNPDGTLRPEHDAYAYGLAEALWKGIPLLIPLLRDAGAYVAAAPGRFDFVLPEQPRRQYTVEAAIPHTYMLPWASEAERSMPQ